MARTAQRRRLGRYRAAITTALESLEDGNPFEAMAILRAALGEDDVELGDRPYACPHCPGLSFEWPGLLDHHLRVSHPEELAA